MFKFEKLLLILLISICLVVTIVVLDAAIDPANLIRTAYARLSDGETPAPEEIFVSVLEVSTSGSILETAEEAVSVVAENGWEIFRSEGFAFEIQFPREIVRKSILNQDVINSGAGVAEKAPVWEFRLDTPAYYNETNLIDASLLIHVLEGQEQEDQCSGFKPGSIYQTPNQWQDSLGEVDINGVSFKVDEVIEGVMGEFYHRISYRTFSKGACYELTQLIHYRNMDNLVDPNVREFDRDSVVTELNQVLETFSLLDVEPTFPEQSYPVPKTFSSAVSKSASNNVDGLDVSHWQGTINWTKVANAGYDFTFAKGTEGVGWTDSKFLYNMNSGDNAGVMMGVYHFARPDLGNSGVAEANYFLSVAGDYLNSGYLRPVLDLEVGTSLGKTALSKWVLDWMQTVKNRTGIEPLIYTNLNFINNYLTDAVTTYDLWIAYWSCSPTPTYTIPPTGKWRDWAFWQYYGPGGCGGNAGYVPGITTNIDLNIFNGVEAGLQEYDAFSHLWVSLSSDVYNAPVPYYADITANVNGDTTGPIDYAFWWDCPALESDISLVQGSCGVLPVPSAGSCLINAVGMRCIGINNELQLAEYTYPIIGNYTAKVIVKRGTAAPAEDRYKISTYNPLKSLTANPLSPAVGIVGVPFAFKAKVVVDTSVSGALQVSLDNPITGEIYARDCQTVAGDIRATKDFSLNWTASSPGEVVYKISTRYRAGGNCPVDDQHQADLTQLYIIKWEKDSSPVLEIIDQLGDPLLSGTTVDLGEVEPFQTITINYEIKNPSASLDFEVSAVAFENLVNISNPVLEPAVPLAVGPGEVVPVSFSFEIPAPGQFSIDIAVVHNATNPSPFLLTLEGSALPSSNPILALSPAPVSPGSSTVNETYQIQVEVEVDVPSSGVLSVVPLDAEGNPAAGAHCEELNTIGLATLAPEFSWTEQEPGLKEYSIWARYRPQGSCPVTDTQVGDQSLSYQIDWQADLPVFELQDSSANPLPDGGLVDLEDQEAFQTISRDFLVLNPSGSAFQITKATFGDLVNVLNPNIDPAVPLEVNPGEQVVIAISFMTENPGDFSFSAALDHNASNPVPYGFLLEGRAVLTQNPLQSIGPTPATPGSSLINQPFNLNVDVGYEAPVNGALQVELVDSAGISVEKSNCELIDETGPGTAAFSFSWQEQDPGIKEYSIIASFFSYDNCQTDGEYLAEIELGYQVEWALDIPVLELKDEDGNLLPDGQTLDLGQYEFYQNAEIALQINNTSTTSELEISGITLNNLSNISNVTIDQTGPIAIAPNGKTNLNLSFLVDKTGPFSFELKIDHLGSNPSPYQVTFEGDAVMSDNPIKFVVTTPPSPAGVYVGTEFSLRVDVGIDAPDVGALQVSLVESGTGAVNSKQCLQMDNNLNQARTFDLNLTRLDPGVVDYSLRTQYRAQADCPISDTRNSDISQNYQISWEEDIPTLEVKDISGGPIVSGTSLDLGLKMFYQVITLEYTLRNTSTTSNLEISSLAAANLVNLDQVEITPVGLISISPEGEQIVRMTFQVTELGLFGFDLEIGHGGSNPSPFRIGFTGLAEMSSNPIQSIEVLPASPGAALVSETYSIQVQSTVDPPAPGVLVISLFDADSELIGDPVCLVISEVNPATLEAEFSWQSDVTGSHNYLVQASYQAEGNCPLAGEPDAELAETYQVNWQINNPVLMVNRPEGVTIFDGAVDYIGIHDFFRFVEVTYLISNDAEASTLVIENIQAENMQNLREVLIDPAMPFEVAPGESQEVKINFQVLILEPYSFDLVWEHNGSNSSPYRIQILGDASLNLGDWPVDSWLYKLIENLSRSEFFLKLKIFW